MRPPAGYHYPGGDLGYRTIDPPTDEEELTVGFSPDMGDDQAEVDARFAEMMRSRDGIEIRVRLAAAEMGVEVLDEPPPGSYVDRVIGLRHRLEAGELTEEQFSDELRKLRSIRGALQTEEDTDQPGGGADRPGDDGPDPWGRRAG
ncbi:hypothetical protein ACNTMW_32330 [Planosporangium sp. 12N6]|uniref:hypothetical protein n=1 Tax=Planosporangium spinosum TaxID=3402278 RepID=UPI003CF33915